MVVTIGTYFIHALRGFGKKSKLAMAGAEDVEKLNARKTLIEEKQIETKKRPITSEQKVYRQRDYKQTSSRQYSRTDESERRYRKVNRNPRLTVINDMI